MGHSRPRSRPVHARRRRPALPRPSSAEGAATSPGALAAASPSSCCPSDEAPPSAPAPPLLPDLLAAADDVRDLVPFGGDDVVLDTPLPSATAASATAATLAAAALLAHRRSDPAIVGRRARRSPAPVPRTPFRSCCSYPTSVRTGLQSCCDVVDPAVMVEGLGFLSLPPAASSGSGSDDDEGGDAGAVVQSTQLLPTASQELHSVGSPVRCVGLEAGSWASLSGKDDDSDEEELAPMTPPATKRPAQPCEGLEAEACGDWQEVLPRRSPRRPASLTPVLPSRPIPAWLFGRCCRCLALGHRAAVCRDPFRCSRCLENGHRARDCRNPWRPLSSMPCLGVPRVSRRCHAEHRHAPASCVGSMESTPSSKALRCGSWASVVSAPARSVPSSDVVFQSALAAQAEQLQGCLARVGSFLERAEAALSRLSLLPAMLTTSSTSRPLDEIGAGSTEDKGAELYGSFSPRVGDISSSLSALPSAMPTAEDDAITEVVAPVLQSMPELGELCVSHALPLSAEHLKVDSSVTLSSHVRSDVASASISPPPSHDPDTKVICDLLSGLEVAIPGLGRAIACLLTGSTIKDKSKKVSDCPRADIQKKKSLRCKDKKNDSIGKVPVVA